MRPSRILPLLCAALMALAGALAAGLAPPAGGQESGERPEVRALAEAEALGRSLFSDPALGTAEKSCAKCHENPSRPKLHLNGRAGDYPKYDRREGRVITLAQKMNQMIGRMLKGEPLPLGSERLVALEAYVMFRVRGGE